MEKIKISAVSYLNTKPFLKGFELSDCADNFEISLDYPSDSAQKLIVNTVDIALVPVAILPQLPNAKLQFNYGIGAFGAVKTVCLFSHFPIHEIKTIVLDYQSKTSVQLVQILTKYHWKINPEFKQGELGFEENRNSEEAIVVIGDRTIDLFDKYPFVYDLSEAWLEFTQLGFVFATWVSSKELSKETIGQLNAIFEIGIQNIDLVIAENQQFNTKSFSVERYLKKNINFVLEEKHWSGMKKFIEYIS